MTDDPHDGMMPTSAQRLAADAAAKRRAEIAADPSLALCEPENGGARLWLALVAVAVLAMLAWPVFAQPEPCGDREDIISALTGEKWGERFIANGIAVNEITEMWANAETGTWTVTGTDANGRTCVRAAGQGFQVEPFLSVVTGDPA